MLDFDSDSLIFDPTLFFAQKCPKSAESKRIFHLKRRGDRGFTLTYLDTQMVECFPRFFYFSRLEPSSGRRRGGGVKVGTKKQTLGLCHFRKNADF